MVWYSKTMYKATNANRCLRPDGTPKLIVPPNTYKTAEAAYGKQWAKDNLYRNRSMSASVKNPENVQK